MPTLESLKRRLESVDDLHSVVKTMKAMAAVNIRQFEKNAAALEHYRETVELGFQAVMRRQPQTLVGAQAAPQKDIVAIVFGSDQGMCGRLNEKIVDHVLTYLENRRRGRSNPDVMVVGQRAAGRLEDRGRSVNDLFGVPLAQSGVTPLVRRLLFNIEARLADKGPQPVHLFYCRYLKGAAFEPHRVQLLPLDRRWLENVQKKIWPGPSLPLFTMNQNELFSALVRQYLTISLASAAVESLASENASRLAAMQGAEKSIEDQRQELEGAFHRQRQMAITEELLDIVAGFEALKKPDATDARA